MHLSLRSLQDAHTHFDKRFEPSLFPAAEGDPYYPIPRPENQELFKRYEALADATSNVTFVGRLATYRYYNMDQIVGQALATFRRMDEARLEGPQREPAAAAA